MNTKSHFSMDILEYLNFYVCEKSMICEILFSQHVAPQHPCLKINIWEKLSEFILGYQRQISSNYIVLQFHLSL